LNAETITTIIYIYFAGAAIVSICAAQLLEKRLKARLPQTLPYRWGYYCGCMALACSPFAVLFTFATIISAASGHGERLGECLVYTALCGIQTVCGWFIIKRRWWAWVLSTIFSFNIVLWIINAIYGSKRRNELSKTTAIEAPPIPPRQREFSPHALVAPTAEQVSLRKNSRAAVFFFLGAIALCVVALCVSAILFFRPWEKHQTLNFRPDEPEIRKAKPVSEKQSSIEAFLNSPLAPPDIFQVARPSVVLLTMQDARGHTISLGSGFFIDKDVVATNFHVIEDAAAGYAKVAGRTAKLNIKGTLSVDALHDLALIQLETSSTPALWVISKLSVSIGDTVYAIGNPEGLEGTFSQGVVSSIRQLGSDRMLQITAPISPGSSGGPVLDQNGSVVGVAFASIENGQNLNFAIPSNYLAALLGAKRDLRPFHQAIPRAKPRETLLDRIGTERPVAGVVGENLTWEPLFGWEYGSGVNFSFSLHNKLAQNVSGVQGFMIFYNPDGEPLDSLPFDYEGIIPAHSAKRISGKAATSVYKMWSHDAEFFSWWDKRVRAWRKTGNIDDIPREVTSRGEEHIETEHREGKVEVRILDFTVE
jgi:S1-C subfamily serine protease